MLFVVMEKNYLQNNVMMAIHMEEMVVVNYVL